MVSRKAEGTARRGFPRWAIVVVSFLAVLAVVAGVSIWYQKNPPAPVAAPSSSEAPAPVGGEFPNGCLAGKDTSVDALIAAQKKATHTEADAVGLAAAFMRWATQYPYPSTVDGEKLLAALASTKADPSILDIPANIVANKPRDGWVSGGVSFAEGRYLIDNSTQDTITVSLGGQRIKNGLPIPDNRVLGAFTLVWEGDVWKLQSSLEARTDQNLFVDGTSLVGGC